MKARLVKRLTATTAIIQSGVLQHLPSCRISKRNIFHFGFTVEIHDDLHHGQHCLFQMKLLPVTKVTWALVSQREDFSVLLRRDLFALEARRGLLR